MLQLKITKRTDPLLLSLMNRHYSQPKGFVGRNICYAIFYDEIYYGHIVAGSATRFLPGRNEYLQQTNLNTVVNNIFYHVEKVDNKYPVRNFSTKVIRLWREQIKWDWKIKYGEDITGYESLVELPRTGECYLRDGWVEVGITKGCTCKRTAGKGTDNWTGKRVWDTINLRPKRVLCRKVE